MNLRRRRSGWPSGPGTVRWHGLRTKVAVLLVVLVASAAALGGWLSSCLLGRWAAQTSLEQTGHMAEMLRLSVADRLARGDVAAVQQVVDRFSRHPFVLAADVHTPDGALVARALAGDLSPAVLGAAEAPVLAVTERLGPDRMWATRPVLADTDGEAALAGSIRLVVDTRSMGERLRRAQVIMGLLVFAFVLGLVPVSHYVVTLALVRPIRRLVAATGRLAEGDWSVRADDGGRDEIDALAHSFNAMAERLDRQRRLLMTTNERLEEQVRRRTADLDHANARLRADMADHQQFLCAVTHDLNAPLRNIGGMAAMALRKWRDQLPADVVNRFERIEANVVLQTDLINDLLELSRIGTRPPRPTRVDVAAVLEQVRCTFEFDLRTRNIELRIEPGLPPLYAETNHVRQVFQNLIDNAIKYMGGRPDGRIAVSCDEDERSIIFHVADNGIGIAAEDQQRIFTVFRRAAAVPPDTTGKGVGLAGVGAVARRYDGRVWVTSELGRGSVFHVAFSKERCTAPNEDATADDLCSEHSDAACHPVG
ncbi:MAG: HAMP domain-containing histidine kinase [Planctomycetes bacterium]|nr:HAMP domain-containing histidine kinase [Planctomycetota bacterium]